MALICASIEYFSLYFWHLLYFYKCNSILTIIILLIQDLCYKLRSSRSNGYKNLQPIDCGAWILSRVRMYALEWSSTHKSFTQKARNKKKKKIQGETSLKKFSQDSNLFLYEKSRTCPLHHVPHNSNIFRDRCTFIYYIFNAAIRFNSDTFALSTIRKDDRELISYSRIFITLPNDLRKRVTTSLKITRSTDVK